MLENAGDTESIQEFLAIAMNNYETGKIRISAAEHLEPRSYLSVGPTGVPFDVAQANINGAPSVAAAANGSALAAWWQQNGVDGTDIFAQRFTMDGALVGSTVRVNTFVAGNQDGGEVAMWSDGSSIIQWTRLDSSGNALAVYAQRYDAAGSAVGDELLLSAGTGASSGGIAAFPGGGFISVWFRNSLSNVYGRVFDASGNPLGAEFSLTTSGVGYTPSVYAYGSGAVQAFWTTLSGTAFCRRFSAAGAPLSSPVQIASNTVAVDSSGAFATLTPRASGSDQNLILQRYDVNATATGPEVQVNSNTVAASNTNGIGTFGQYAISTAPGGGFLCAWKALDYLANSTTIVRSFDASGIATSTELTADPIGSVSANYPAIATSSAGISAVVYVASGTIRAQRFNSYSHAGAVGDRVWVDANADGLQNSGEAGLDGIGVILYDSNGIVAGSAVTAGGGSYLISNVRPGQPVSAFFHFQQQQNLIFTLAKAGTDPALDSDPDRVTGATPLFTLGDDETRNDIDAGMLTAATISGLLYNDMNGDGRLDGDENLLGDANVYLDTNHNHAFDNGEPSSSSMSSYIFGGLLPGTYLLSMEAQDLWITPTPISITVNVGEARSVNLATLTPSVPIAPIEATNALPADTNTTSTKADLATGIDLAGNFVVAWSSSGQDGSGYGIYGQRFNAVGAKLGGEFLINTTTVGDQRNPVIAMDDAGNFVVVWTSGGDLYQQRYSSAGSRLGSEVIVNTVVAGEQSAPAISMDRLTGRYVIVWQSLGEDGDGYGIFAQQFDAAGTPVGTAFQVNQTIDGSQSMPTVALGSDGRMLFSWQGNGGASVGYDIYARWFDALNAAAGNEFLINSSRADDQTNPSALVADDGRFAISWLSDGSRYFQRYDAAGSAQGTQPAIDAAFCPAFASDSLGNFEAAAEYGGQFTYTCYSASGAYAASGYPQVNNSISGMTSMSANRSGSFVIAWYNDTLKREYVRAYSLLPGVHSISILPSSTSHSAGLAFIFSEDLQDSISAADLQLVNQSTQQTIDPGAMQVDFDSTSSTARWTFPGLADGMLPSGFYIATIPHASIANSFGTQMGADVVFKFLWIDGTSGDDTCEIDADGDAFLNTPATSPPTYTTLGQVADAVAFFGSSGNDLFQVDVSDSGPTFYPFFDGGDGDANHFLVSGSSSQEMLSLDANRVFFIRNPARTTPFATFLNCSLTSFSGDGGNDRVYVISTPMAPLQFDSGGGSNILEVDGGTLTVAGDLGAQSSVVMAINVTAHNGIQFLSSEHLRTTFVLRANSFASIESGGNKLFYCTSLNINSSAVLDLNDNDLLVNYSTTSPLSTIQSLINTARAAGAWTGSGISSSAAKYDSKHITTLGAMEASDYKSIYGANAKFDNESIDNTAVLVKYTYYGDANFSGFVDGGDYARMDLTFGKEKIQGDIGGWINGDINGDGRVDGSDYGLADLAFGAQGSPINQPPALPPAFPPARIDGGHGGVGSARF